MMEICGTLEQLTAETIWAPFLMMDACSALEPTMNPVTLWKNTMGVFLQYFFVQCIRWVLIMRSQAFVRTAGYTYE